MVCLIKEWCNCYSSRDQFVVVCLLKEWCNCYSSRDRFVVVCVFLKSGVSWWCATLPCHSFDRLSQGNADAEMDNILQDYSDHHQQGKSS